jgi:phytoene dehydrogenase-like protein
MSHYTIIRNGRHCGVKALTDAMADRLEAQGAELIPTAEPVQVWVPGRVSKQQRQRQERATFAEVIAIGRHG